MADPRDTLRGKDVTERAAAARELARTGEWGDVAELLGIAIDDRSPSMRLYAAAAATNILHRLRLEHGDLSPSQKQEIVARLRPVDPANNPAILLCWSALPDRDTIDRIGRLLRDLRADVREAALIAFSRMVKSAIAPGPERFDRAVRGVLEHKKLHADVALGLVNLAGEVGWSGLEDAVRGQAVTGRLLPEAIELALQRLSARQRPESWEGLWVSDGRDVGLEAKAGDLEAFVISGGRLHDTSGSRDFTVEEGLGRADGYGSFRMIWAKQVGEDGLKRALQSGGTTWWKPESIASAAESIQETLTGAVAQAVADSLAEVDGALAARLRPILLYQAGNPTEALSLLERLVGTKKPRNDLFYWYGVVLNTLGRPKEAVVALKRFVDKAGKAARWRKQAEALLSRLG